MEHEVNNKYLSQIQQQEKKINQLIQENKMQVFNLEREKHDHEESMRQKYNSLESILREEFEREIEMIS